MPDRRSVYIAGAPHSNPIPNACVLGNVLVSGLISGIDPATGKQAEKIEDQVRFMFEHAREVMEAAGGGLDQIVKFTVWMNDRNQRDVVNAAWVKIFADEKTRPARTTLNRQLEAGKFVECEIMAVL